MPETTYSMYLIKEPFRVTGGFYVDGKFNSLVCVDGKSYRRRVELLCIHDKSIWLDFDIKKKTYTIPGGDCERNTPDSVKLINDCVQSTGAIPNHIMYKLTYKIDFDEVSNFRPSWMNDLPILYDGVICAVYIGYCDVPPEVLKRGEWYPMSKVKPILKDPHLKALKHLRR